MPRRKQIWLVSVVVWLAGAVGIYVLWSLHFRNGSLDTIWGFIVYLLAFFYFVVFFPIYNAVSRAMSTEVVELGPYELEIVYRDGIWEGGLFRRYDIYPKPKNPRLIAEDREELIDKAREATERLVSLGTRHQ